MDANVRNRRNTEINYQILTLNTNTNAVHDKNKTSINNNLRNSYLNPKLKKEETLKWENNSINNSNITNKNSEPLDVSHYTLKKKKTIEDLTVSLNNKINLNKTHLGISSESSTGASVNKYIDNLPISSSQINHESPFIKSQSILKEDLNLYDSLVYRSSINNRDINIKNSIFAEDDEFGYDDLEGIKTVDEMGFVLQEASSNSNDDEYIWDNSIKIISFLSQGAQAKVYLGLVMETDSYVAIKRYFINYNEDNLNRIIEECELIKCISHKNIIKYFDMEYVLIEENSEANKEYPEYEHIGSIESKIKSRIDMIMEYVDGMNLKDYITKHSCYSCGINMKDVKFITKNILEGLKHLHENKIIHRDLKPENVIVTDDLQEIKIVDFGISTRVKLCETFQNRSVLGTAYYMAPEVISEKPYAYEADIWSLGCIVYELVSGVKPYGSLNPVNAMYFMVQFASPLEYADENIKDIFYDKSNRSLLDFLQKCWRPNNSFRPSAEEILQHAFLN